MISILKNALVVRALFVLLFTAPVLGVVLMATLRPATMMARHMGSELDSLPDRLVPVHLQEIAKLGQPGVEVLVEALGNPRSIVADSATCVLHAQLDAWARLPASESSPRVAHLAQLLAQRVGHWDIAPRCAAADMVARILHWPLDLQSVAKADLLAHCEQVLQSAPLQPQLPPAVVAADQPSDSARLASHAVTAVSDPGGILELPLAGTPGGDLPVEEVPIPPMPPSLANPPPPRPLTDGDPHLIVPEARELPRVIFPDERPAQEPTSVFPTSPVPQQLMPGIEQDSQAKQLAPTTATVRATSLARLPDLDLIRRLGQAAPTELSDVEQQLRQRGFNDMQLELARRVADPDPRVRRQLAESLADLRTSPGPWLFWLSYDPDPLVRRTVVSLMATSQDSRLHRRLREMHSLETDDGIRAQLERLIEKQGGR